MDMMYGEVDSLMEDREVTNLFIVLDETAIFGI